MALVAGALGLEYAVAFGALIYGEWKTHHQGGTYEDRGPDPHNDKLPDSGIAPDDDDPANSDGGVNPETIVPINWRAGPFDTHQSLAYLEVRRQWAIIRRAWSRTVRHLPWMTVSSIIAVYRGYHIYLSVREAVAARRASIALSKGRGVPPETPITVRKMIYASRFGVNEQLRRGVKRAAGFDPFDD